MPVFFTKCPRQRECHGLEEIRDQTSTLTDRDEIPIDCSREGFGSRTELWQKAGPVHPSCLLYESALWAREILLQRGGGARLKVMYESGGFISGSCPKPHSLVYQAIVSKPPSPPSGR